MFPSPFATSRTKCLILTTVRQKCFHFELPRMIKRAACSTSSLFDLTMLVGRAARKEAMQNGIPAIPKDR
jgi:hypothetical protein